MRRNMSDPDKIIESQAKEQKALDSLREKRILIDKQIKEAEGNIRKYDEILSHMRISDANKVLAEKGISLDELMSAVYSGDFGSLSNKLQATDLTDKPQNATDAVDFEEINEILNNS